MKPLQSQHIGDVVVVCLNDRKLLHEDTIRMLGNELNEMALAASVTGKFLIDFRNVVTMSSMMISAILKLQKRCKRDKIKLKLCNISPSLMEAFKITGLVRILDIRGDEKQALAAFEKRWRRA